MARSSTAVAVRGPAIPPALRPVVRAYLLGYASSVGPRLVTVLLSYLAAVRRQRRKGKAVDSPTHPSDDASNKASLAHLRSSVTRTLRAGLEWRRFPAFCATLVGGTTLLETPLARVLARLLPSLSLVARARLSRWLASFIAGYGGLRLLQKQTPSFTDVVETEVVATNPETKEQIKMATTSKTVFAGRTLDLTLFAVTRALDVIVGELWTRRKERKLANGGKWSRFEALVGQLTDPAIFSASSALVMWAWFYMPSRLPRAYQSWITAAAAVDDRLIEVLRLCRTDRLQYGQDNGPDARVLQGMCTDYDWPLAWGDPEQTVPFPCTIVHMDCGPSCEVHAMYRLWRSWRWAMATYLPLSLLMVLKKPNRNARGVVRALLSAARSSAFLGTFIMLFYYGVCLARTRIGPFIGPHLLKLAKSTGSVKPSSLSPPNHVHQIIDGGVCTATGCALCGWSILIERASRRKDMGLFVAPRALATLFPRRYALDKQWRETVAFAASAAVVFTAIQENPKRVRGVMGSVLKTVLC
ncbi:integral membrane protein [Ophiostoma piceae UAMH 11346]|uniref:Integral membrane protein n=1 Tax=Ophiostoma piceae (strain UAMH 11346) TaxID=1262450 RepID=S3C4Q5_OPHP1|nr:integral membrane protein [Ophiostoma piceae UAMH 11346]